MWIPLQADPPEEPGVDGQPSRAEPFAVAGRRRRGVTAMEYLVMASLIITVVIAAVQSIGGKAGNSLANSANAIKAAEE